jgi:general secretion pathway protein D
MYHSLKHPVLRTGAIALLVSLAGCASLPQPHDDGALQREAIAGTDNPVPPPTPLNTDLEAGRTHPAQLLEGSGQFIRPTALATPRPGAHGDGAVTFNFENQPVQAVVKAILGDLLKTNYTIVPGVQGNISFATSEPVDSGQALPILEMLLSWTGNALVQRNGGYVVMKAKDAVAGNLVPGLGASAPTGGLQARLFPLHYIAASEMQKLIKPFAREDSVLLVDPARNLLVLSGTPDELANYQRTVRTFDVDWLRGMSVGVFSLERASVTELMPKLDGMFGKNGDTPLAGMLRFIPIERTNALVVISTQPDYLSEVGEWIARIDKGGGNEPQLYVYDVRNIKASDLAQYLGQIYTNGNAAGGGNAGQVGPGLNSTTLGVGGGNATGMGANAGGFGGVANGLGGGGLNGTDPTGRNGQTGGLGGLGTGNANGFNNPVGGTGMTGMNGQNGTNGQAGGGNSPAQQYASEDGSIRISSVDANNQLLVRARPSQWSEIQDAIQHLDLAPLQVQIETRILEVKLTGQFSFGVQWYLEGLIGGTNNGNGTYTPGQPGNQQQWGLGQGGTQYNPGTAGATGDAFFYSFVNHNLQVALRAVETSGNTKTLSAPSLVVLNNQLAQISVGAQVPINQTSVSTIGTTSTFNQVSYLNTGVMLNVTPRVNPGGLVYLNVQQQVSTPDYSQSSNGNPTVSERSMNTQIAVQNGQTVLLGGLIQQDESVSDTGIPGLNRIPVLGRLFGSTTRSRDRTELLVLITPRVISNGEQAKTITDEYQRKFESLAPLRAGQAAPAAIATPTLQPAQTQPLRH